MPSDDIKIKHRPASNFVSQYATGILLSGPTPDGKFHLLFYSDAIEIRSETGSAVAAEPGTYITSVSADDRETFREDKVIMTMDADVMKSLAILLGAKFNDEAQKTPSE